MAAAVAGCGSAAPAPSGAVTGTCQEVSAALSDGPDPSADPVGYAEAQVVPLRQITTSDASLRHAIGDLASAYEQFYSSNASSEASQAVSQASAEVDAICPGATS
ncbi:MAG: hypothetical protein WB802_13365 [Candidatus Dormiibacterota bacterium]